MRAWEIAEGFGLSNLRMVERPSPKPGPGEVRVKMLAASLNYRDLLMIRGKYNPRQPLPLIPLSDGVGVVDAVGEGVLRVKAGERVAGHFCQRWLSGEPDHAILKYTLGGPIDGMLAEEVVLSAEGVVPVPEHLNDAEASTLPCAALTAWSALVTMGKIKAGETVLVQGTGGVSLFALQFATLLGARVIGTSGRAEGLDRLTALGASETINYRSDTDWGRTALRMTGYRGVDHVVEVGGVGTLEQSMRAVRPGGQISLIGILAGRAAPVDMTPVLMRNVRVQGVLVGHRESFEAMNRAIAHHRMRPIIDRIFPFEEAPAALQHLASATHLGKICISGTGSRL